MEDLWELYLKHNSCLTAHMVLFPTLSTNCTKIGKRSSVSKRSLWKFTGRSPNAQDRQDITANHHQGKTRRTKVDAICSTSIIYMHHHPIKHICYSTRQSHPRHFIVNICQRINFSTFSCWRTKPTYRHRWRRHYPTTFKCIVIMVMVMVIGIIIKEEERTTHSSTNKSICATNDNGLAESGIFSLERGNVIILLSYHHMDYFFTSTQLCVLPLSLFLVIAHSAIHAFLVSWLIVYMTHFIYLHLCTCISTDSYTYFSIDTHTSIDS